MISNQGSDAVLAGFDVLVFEDLDGDGVYSPGVDQFLGAESVVPPFAAGAVLPVAVDVAGTLQFRDGLIHAWVDSGETQAESDESDNVAETGAGCRRPPVAANFDMVIEWEWTEAPVLGAPLVGDVNADGTPDVVFASIFNEIVVLDGRTGVEHWRTSDPRIVPAGTATPALAELDGDPGLEVVALVSTGSTLAMWDDDGSLVWESGQVANQINLSTGAVTLADLDCDGQAEAIFESGVVRTSDGSWFWRPARGVGTVGASLQYAGISSTADVDADGVLEVIAGPTAWVADPLSGFGTPLWWNTIPADGFTAIGQFDADPAPEVVLVSPGTLYVLEGETGAIKWETPLPPGGSTCSPPWFRGGPPTVADVDGDGEPEIGVADSEWYFVFETDGTLKWQVPTSDCSSAGTGSTVFDFDGDGSAEVVYQDEEMLHVYRGSDGFELASFPSSSGTVQESPTIADVDGRAEIIAALHPWAGRTAQGIRVYGDRNDNWVSARRIWNQHAYQADNINADGRIPPAGSGACQPKSWLTHGTYRLQLPPEGSSFGQPDVTLTILGSRLQPAATCGSELVVDARVGNGGAVSVGRPFAAWIYEGDPAAGGQPIQAVALPNLRPGEWRDITLTAPVRSPATFHVVADDDGTGVGLVWECREDNNSCAVDVTVIPPASRFPDPVGPALRAPAHGDPLAPSITGTFAWPTDGGLPRPVGEHYHVQRATRADALVLVPGSHPLTQLSWVDATLASTTLPTCHYIRIAAADDCEVVEVMP